MEGTSFNPWSTDRCTATLKSAILLAQRTGHFVRNVGPNDAKLLAERPSLKQIGLQREISRQRKELNKTNLEIHQKMQHHETKDLIQEDVLGKKTEQLKALSSHLQCITNNKDSLINRLQQPFVGDHIRVNAAYHKETVNLFRRVAPLLSGLAAYLDDISWMNKQDFANGKLDDVLSELSVVLANLQSNFQAITTMTRDITVMQTGDSSVLSPRAVRGTSPL